MNTSIQMGNDEFILYIRKNHPDCLTSNDQLGKRIWQRIRELDATAEEIDNGKSVPCYWGGTGENIDESKLPKTATQFRFERKLLPELYDHLDALASEHHAAPMPALA